MDTFSNNKNSIKNIYIPPASPILKRTSNAKLHSKPNEPKKRMITESKRWDFRPDEQTLEYQLLLLVELRDYLNNTKKSTGETEGCRNNTIEYNSRQFGRENSVNEPVVNANIPSRIQLIKQLIHSKWYGYRAQDMEKNLFCIDDIINELDIVDLLIDSRLLCFYCRKETQVLYEHVREPLQWSIERIDNKKGHDRGNVVIACLGCNLRRKTMYYERFRMTKQLHIVKHSGTV